MQNLNINKNANIKNNVLHEVIEHSKCFYTQPQNDR